MDVLNIFVRFYIPPLCLLGAIGNFLSVCVFCMTSGHRHLSSSYYLSALAISDIGFLINLFAVWLTDEIGFSVITTSVTCPLIMYLGQVTCSLSVWLVVAFTCERYCAVCYPLTRPTICTVSRAKKVIGVITIVALLAFSYVWVIAAVIPMHLVDIVDGTESAIWEGGMGIAGEGFQNVTTSQETLVNRSEIRFICTVPDEYHEVSMMANNFDSFFTLILPFCVITFLNCRITFCVWKFKGEREAIVASSSENRKNSVIATDKTQSKVVVTATGNILNNKRSAARTRKLRETEKKQGKSSTATGSPTGSRPSAGSSAAEVRVTKTLLLVSTVFLVLNLPSHAIRFVSFVQRVLLGASSENSSDVFPYQQWANILFNTNFSVNFLLYCVSGRNFRNSLRTLCTSRDEIKKLRIGGGSYNRQQMSPKPKPLLKKNISKESNPPQGHRCPAENENLEEISEFILPNTQIALGFYLSLGN